MSSSLPDAVSDVLARDACTGCGLCALLDPAIQMSLDESGYMRPEFAQDSRAPEAALKTFQQACPGVLVRAPKPPRGASQHPLLGSYVGMWAASATDPDIRHAGSSGGALTALHTWLLETGRAARITGAAADRDKPRSTVPVTITTRDEALRAAGSRYAPVAALSNAEVLRGQSAVCGKPCEASAMRSAWPHLGKDEAPLLLSFFCAGTPSQFATDKLLADGGIAPTDDVSILRYRGEGWPGKFTAVAGETTVSVDYEASWGKTLGPTTQWRCKVCVDGIGESADVVAADSWESDERGFPVFNEQAGLSALIARTERGARIVEEARAAGVIELSPLSAGQLAAAQPLQTARRQMLGARVLASRIAGRAAPRYPGYAALLAKSLTQPRTAFRTLKGTMSRIRRARSAQ